MRPQLRLAAGGTVTYRPPDDQRPSAASAALYAPDGTVITAVLSVTTDSVNTTTAALATEGGGSLTLTSVTGVEVGEYYRVQDALGRFEVVRVVSVDPDSKVVQVMRGLRHGYASGSTFQGTRLSVTLTGSELDEIGEGYEIRWAYTAGGVSTTAVQLVDCVRSPWPSRIVSSADLDRAGLARELARNAREELLFGDELRSAELMVREAILARGRRPDRFRGFAAFVPVVLEAVHLERARTGLSIPGAWQNDPTEYRKMRRADFERLLGQALANTRDYDEDQDGTVTATERDRRVQVVELSL